MQGTLAEYGLIGSIEAKEGTIRKLYGESVKRNAVHGSDSDSNAEFECDFFFAKSERFSLFD